MQVFKEKIGMIDMLEFIKEIEEESTWYVLKLRDFSTAIESGGGLIIPSVKEKYRFIKGTTDEAILSTIENGCEINTVPGSQMLVITSEISKNSALLLGDTGLLSLITRSGADCTATSKASLVDKKTIIDIGLKNSGEKTVLALFSCGKIRTFNGGNTYSVLKQSSMFEAIIKMLNTSYKGYSFKEGFYSHIRTKAKFELNGNTSAILESYKNACEQINSIKNKGLKVVFTFSTSEIGDECATMSVSLVRGNLEILLGSPIKVQHSNNTTIEDFTKELPLLLAKTKDLVGGLEQLINIEIKNPINCAINIAKNVGLAKTQTMASLADVQKTLDTAKEKKKTIKFSAHDVFYVLQESLMEMRKHGVASSTIEKCEENLARTLVKDFDWNEYDTVVRPEWNNK